MMNTLCLARDTWDLFLDASGNIAMASDPYARAQDVASAVRVFLGECWYDVTLGLPYLPTIMNTDLPPIYPPLVKKTALTVPGVVKAQCYITGFKDRALSGFVQFTDVNGVTQNVALGPVPAMPSGAYVTPSYVSPNYVR